MPLVQYYKFERVLKARRKRVPAWQYESPPDSPAGEDAYDIAAKHEKKFSRAFLALLGALITPSIARAIRAAWSSGDIRAVMAAIPFFDSGAQENVWEGFTDDLEGVYGQVVGAAGSAAMSAVNSKFGQSLAFTSANEFSKRWIRERALELVTQGITEQQRAVVGDILADGFERGLRAEEGLKAIRDNIGLTEREYGAVLKRRALHEEAGLSEAEVERLTEQYRQELLTKRAERIARTETMFAQSHGRREAWRQALESGKVPAVERRWVAVPSACPICQNLDGQKAPIDGAYQGLKGPVEAPPAHPACRCTEVLQRVGKTSPAMPVPLPPIARPKPRGEPKPKAPPRQLSPVVEPKPVRTKPALVAPTKPRPVKTTIAESELPPKRSVVVKPRTRRPIPLNPKQQLIDQEARWIKGDENKFRSVSKEERAAYMQWNWAHGSNRKMSVRMKQAAAREFNLKGTVYNPRGFRFSDADVDYLRGDMRKIYENTQREFKKRGIAKLKLYRGVKSNVVTPGVMESWTTDPEVARKFGGQVLTQEIPVDRIYNYRGSSNWVDGIFGNQKEVVVLT